MSPILEKLIGKDFLISESLRENLFLELKISVSDVLERASAYIIYSSHIFYQEIFQIRKTLPKKRNVHVSDVLCYAHL